MSDLKFTPRNRFTDLDVQKVEKAVGHPLPKAYVDFMKEYGGVFVNGRLDDKNGVPILSFYGLDDERGVLSNTGGFADFRASGVLPIGRCDLNNVFVMDLDRGGEILYINYYGGKITVRTVASSFQDFLDRLVPDDDDDEDEEGDDDEVYYYKDEGDEESEKKKD